MKATLLLRPLAASTLLLAAACGSSGPANDASNEMALNEALSNYDEALADEDLPANDVDLVSLPPAPAEAPAAETAPLTQAARIASEIDTDTAVERVPFEGGWAWRRGGRIIRTASRDGRRVAWFRPGESTPFLVQQGDETFAYRGGRPQRAFDRRGRPAAVTPQREEEARRLAAQSRRDRDRAERTPRRPDNSRNAANRGDERPDRSSEANSSATGRDDRWGNHRREGRNGDRRSRDDDGNRQ